MAPGEAAYAGWLGVVQPQAGRCEAATLRPEGHSRKDAGPHSVSQEWTRTEILPFCPLFFAAGRLGGGTQKTGKNIALSVFLKGGSAESVFLPHFVGCGFLGVFVRFFAFVRFFLRRVGYGGVPPKKGKTGGLTVFLEEWSAASVFLPQFWLCGLSGVIVRFFVICPLFSAHRPAPKKSGQNQGRALPM